MVLARPLDADAEASTSIPTARRAGDDLPPPPAGPDLGTHGAALDAVSSIAARTTPRTWRASLTCRHPQPADRLAIEATVTRRGLAELLDHRGPDTMAVHDIPCPGDQVVHSVLVCPAGVFVIGVLQVPRTMVMVMRDEVLVGGRETDALARLEAQTRWVGERLGLRTGEMAARGILLVNGYRHLSVRQGSHTPVVSLRGLREWLDRRAPDLSAARVAELSALARDPHTWGLAADWAPAQARPQDLETFDRLVATVRRAGRSRLLLTLSAAVAVVDIVIAGWTWWA